MLPTSRGAHSSTLESPSLCRLQGLENAPNSTPVASRDESYALGRLREARFFESASNEPEHRERDQDCAVGVIEDECSDLRESFHVSFVARLKAVVKYLILRVF